MKRSLMRPTAALFPLAGAIAAVLGDSALVMRFFLYYFMMQLFSLCAVDCFRNAAAREPGLRRVDRRFGASVLPLLAALGLALGLTVPRLDHVQQDMLNLLPVCIAAWCTIIEQLFEERMDAVGKRMDLVLMQAVSALLLLAGLMMDSFGSISAPVPGFYTLCASALGMLIAAAVSLVTEPLRAFSIAPRNLGFAPKAAVQTLLYPLAMSVVMSMQFRRGEAYIHALEQYTVLPLLAGMIPWKLSRTVCRRAQDESRSLNLLLISLAALAIMMHAPLEMQGFAVEGTEILHMCAESLVLALLCGAIVFCAPGVRFYAGTVLILLTGNMCRIEDFPYGGFIIFGLCLIAVILNLKKAFLKKV